ncbi:MAG: hypothetical protein FJW38_31090, partial [Acidobacteria bacterium]|nr:hypothetical protein [Acidobacteriota bacterium]
MAKDDITIRMGVDKTAFDAALTQMQASTQQFGAKMKTQFAEAVSVAAVAAAIQAVVVKMRELKRTAEDVGMSLGFLQTLQIAGEQVGLSSDGMNAALFKFNALIGEARGGSDAAAQKFRDIGISLNDANGNAKTAEQLFLELADAYKNTGSSADRASMSMDFFGKKGGDINNVLERGAAGLKDYQKTLGSAGFLVSDKNVAALAELTHGIKILVGWLENLLGWFVRIAGAQFRIAPSLFEAARHLINTGNFKDAAGVFMAGMGENLEVSKPEAGAPASEATRRQAEEKAKTMTERA